MTNNKPNSAYPIQPLAVSAISIPTTQGKLDGDKQPLVNARDLHDFLGVGRDFSNWIKSRISEYQFTANLDYVEFTPKLAKTSFFGGRPKTEYHISLDMAKELAMVERNAKGRQARRYFIAMEKRAIADAKAAIADQSLWMIDDLQDAYLSKSPADAKLVRYYATGMLTHAEIGKLLGITASTVRYHLVKLGRLGLVQYPRPDDYTDSNNGQLALPLQEASHD